MIVTACNSCFQRYNLLVRPHEQALVVELADKDGLCPCPRLCGGRILLKPDQSVMEALSQVALKEPMSITGTELYQSVHGMGLPDEIPKSVTVLDALLRGKVVEDAVWEEAGGRFYLHELKLSSGCRLHLAAGGRGAQVLKVTQDREAST